jgi:hypothetical protein
MHWTVNDQLPVYRPNALDDVIRGLNASYFRGVFVATIWYRHAVPAWTGKLAHIYIWNRIAGGYRLGYFR